MIHASRRILLPTLLALLAILFASPAQSSDAPDHPLLARYPGATLSGYRQVDYDTIMVPTRKTAGAAGVEFTQTPKVGDITRHYYELRHVSTLKLFENYQQALRALGLRISYLCKLDECGSANDAERLGGLVALSGDVYNDYRKPYFIVAEGKGAKGPIIVALFIGGYEDEASVQQLIVEAEPLETGLVKVNESWLKVLPKRDLAKDPPEIFAEDSPLLPRYPGARLDDSSKVEYEGINLPQGAVAASGKVAMLNLVGDIQRHYYDIAHVSTLKLYENYKTALTKAQFDTVFSCELTECGSAEQAKQLGALVALRGNVYNDYRKPYYLLGKRDSDGGPVYIALFIGGYEDKASVQQVVLQTQPLDNGLVQVTAGSLNRDIEKTGKAAVYGIYFDTDAAAIKAESKPALDAMAGALVAQSGLKLYVVGHTDATGALAHNLDLSQQRAEAVVAALVKDYHIAPARLLAKGMASFAPVASNRDEAGRARNRRVELVEQ